MAYLNPMTTARGFGVASRLRCMNQVLQNLSDGQTGVVEVPALGLAGGGLLIRSRTSLIFAGTERMLVEQFGAETVPPGGDAVVTGDSWTKGIGVDCYEPGGRDYPLPYVRWTELLIADPQPQAERFANCFQHHGVKLSALPLKLNPLQV